MIIRNQDPKEKNFIITGITGPKDINDGFLWSFLSLNKFILLDTAVSRKELIIDSWYLMPGLDWTRLFMSLTAGAGTRCMSLLRDSPTLCSPTIFLLASLLLRQYKYGKRGAKRGWRGTKRR